jgi:hypothetical protein
MRFSAIRHAISDGSRRRMVRLPSVRCIGDVAIPRSRLLPPLRGSGRCVVVDPIASGSGPSRIVRIPDRTIPVAHQLVESRNEPKAIGAKRQEKTGYANDARRFSAHRPAHRGAPFGASARATHRDKSRPDRFGGRPTRRVPETNRGDSTQTLARAKDRRIDPGAPGRTVGRTEAHREAGQAGGWRSSVRCGKIGRV